VSTARGPCRRRGCSDRGISKQARPFTAEPDLFAVPLVQLRDESWVIAGFRNLEPKSIDAFEIIDTIPVTLDDEGYLVAL
jgi:beta-fructofuranosidase